MLLQYLDSTVHYLLAVMAILFKTVTVNSKNIYFQF